jgi:hypothetical protein
MREQMLKMKLQHLTNMGNWETGKQVQYVQCAVYYTEGVSMSSEGTGCIYSTLFDAHIRLIFSRQYHINCLSIQNTYNFIYAYIFDIWPSVSH